MTADNSRGRRGDPPREADGPGPTRPAGRGGDWLPAVVFGVVVAVYLLLESFLPLRTSVEIGADEGFELAKATLCLKGHSLYSEVWNDQPPLHTFIVTEVLKYVSPSVLGPRLVGVISASLLLASVFSLVLRASGLAVAAIAAFMIVLSPEFLLLSGSCMLEIPSLAPAAAGLAVLWCPWSARWRIREVLAGMLLATAMQMKLVPAVLLPLGALALWLQDREAGRAGRSTILSVLLLGTSLVVVYVAIDLLIDRGAYLAHFQQSWRSHFGPAKAAGYGSPGEHPFDWSLLLKNWDATVPALVGIGLGIASIWTWSAGCGHPAYRAGDGVVVGHMPSRGGLGGLQTHHEMSGIGLVPTNARVLFPLAWLSWSFLVFAIHKPWWPYYWIHTAIPLCWCAGIGISWGLSKLHRWHVAGVVAAILFLAGALTWGGTRVYLQISAARHAPKLPSELVLNEIARFKPSTEYLFADQPIYSFHSGIPLPPDLALLPLKRFWAGEMTNERVASELEALKPGLMLLVNDSQERPFQALLQREYRLIYQDPAYRLYARRSIASGPRRLPGLNR